MALYAKMMDFLAIYARNTGMSSHVEFIFQKDAKRIFDIFTRVFGIRIVFFSLSGQALTSGADKKNCKYCRLLRTKLSYENVCRKLDRKKMLQASQEQTLVSYTCHGGMIEAILPVYTVDKLIGYIMIGQFRTSEAMPTLLGHLCKASHGNDRLYKAFLTAPLYPKKRVKEILALFSLLVDLIVKHHMITTYSKSSIHKIISFIDEYPSSDLTLSGAANMLGCSISSISHEFRKMTGRSFRQYIIERRLAKADELLLSNNNSLKIRDIASQVGYADPYMFSRIYKKHRHKSPSGK
jgi:AraC-like DNA-binding protein/ligand-binding sensor protein